MVIEQHNVTRILGESKLLVFVTCLTFSTVRLKIWPDYLNLVIFGDFQNNFRPKNRNFQIFAGPPFGLVLLGNFENFDFLAENYSENSKIGQISEPGQNF